MKKSNLKYKASVLILSTLLFSSIKANSNNLEMSLSLEENNSEYFTNQEVTTPRRLNIGRVIPSSGLSKLTLILITLMSLIGGAEAGPWTCAACCTALCLPVAPLGVLAHFACAVEMMGTACLIPCTAPIP